MRYTRRERGSDSDTHPYTRAVITVEPECDTVHEHAATGVREPAGALPGIAYLLSRYPARSHTFLLNEVLGLRARGLPIAVASINPPDRATGDLPRQEASEARAAFYVKGGRKEAMLWSLLSTACTHPAVVARGLRAIGRLPSLSLRERAFSIFYLAEALLVGRWMQRRRLAHLHVHFGGPVASVGLLTSIAWQVPFSLTIHGPEELLDPVRHQLSAKLSQASFVLCISDFCRDQLRGLTPPAEWPKFRVIRLGVDPLLLAPFSAARPGAHPPPPTLVCVGRLVPEKGHGILLEALRLLRERGIALRAVLIGTGPLEAKLQGRVAQDKMQDCVSFTSGLSHEQTLAQVRCADVFALASFAEGVPVALMEAMSLGVPCVSTAIAGIPELIHTGESGLLVAPGDPVGLADALQALLADDALRRRLGSAGRQRVLLDYNLPLNLDRLAQHFRDRLPLSSTTRTTSSQTKAARRA